MSNIHYLHGQPSPIGQFLRVNRQDHRKLEILFNSGHFAPRRIVFSAGWVNRQGDLLKLMQEHGVETVLDTNVAELSALGRYTGAARQLPWARSDRPLTRADLQEGSVLEQISEFALSHGFDTVLAPTTFLPDLADEHLAFDIATASEFRDCLNRNGGQNIQIDYPLITKYSAFRDGAHRRRCVARLEHGEFGRLWLRVADYGADARPSKIPRYIISASDYCNIGKPIIADHVGGTAGLALAAFGVVSGISHGVGTMERFDTSTWAKLSTLNGGEDNTRSKFGLARRALVPALDRSLKVSEIEQILNARGARRLLLCSDRTCCPHGDEMLRTPQAHYLRQRGQQIAELEAAPNHRRAEHYVFRTLATATSRARQAARLNVSDDNLSKILQRSSESLEDKRLVLESLHEKLDGNYVKAESLPIDSRNNVSLNHQSEGSHISREP